MGVITFKHQCIRPFANSSFFNSQRMSLDLLRRLIAPCEKACVGRDGLLACLLVVGRRTGYSAGYH
eukprot:scaffold11368_cov160-Alexandrium_tamarense.AAC.1